MDTAIKIEGLSVAYTNEDTLTDLSLTVKKGEFVYIIGPNGGGKTTLIKAILGILTPHSGEIKILSKKHNIGKRKIGYVPQKSETERDFPITVLEVVETAFLKSQLNPFRLFKADEKQKAMEYLTLLGVENLAKAQIGTLSGGELQRVLIARALARNPEILILDEPCANTDPPSSKKIHEILDEQNRMGVTVIVVSHDINHVLQSKNRTVFINKQILFDDIADERVLRL
ncbi:MAG: ABC transporter ATP-binding protein [Clostridia bacterium]|nr:ABC transporter ATP-binding protein [Clostridia bacterium]